MSFRRHYIRDIVSRYNNRAARDVQLEAIQRRRAATAVPIPDPNDPESTNRTPEFIAPSKDDSMMRPISVDMVTPYQGRLVLEPDDNEISLEDIDEQEQQCSEEEEEEEGCHEAKQVATMSLNEIAEDEYRNTFHGRPSHLEFKPNLEMSPADDGAFANQNKSSYLDEPLAARSPLDDEMLGEFKEEKTTRKKSSKGSFSSTPCHLLLSASHLIESFPSHPCRLSCSNS
jgi:hypothetical protein